ncbi:MAG TPA: MAPEG family protein [Rhodanobacteraceae bacterium]|nr:MAPEG family protein [Rhodanobacteraceae bacterium]
MHVSGLYAALGALLISVLALRVMSLRHRHHVGLGAGGNESLARAIRAHANAVEYLPIALLLLLILELNQTRVWLVHVFGIVLIVARVLHAIGLSARPGYSFGRFVGTALTIAVMLAMALLLLWQFAVLPGMFEEP